MSEGPDVRKSTCPTVRMFEGTLNLFLLILLMEILLPTYVPTLPTPTEDEYIETLRTLFPWSDIFLITHENIFFCPCVSFDD